MPRAKTGSLARYAAKRDFTITPEPAAGGKSVKGALQFVIQKHWASRLHYDFRLELDDFKQGFLAGWMHAQGWTGVPSFEQFSAAAVAWEGWLDAQKSTKQ